MVWLWDSNFKEWWIESSLPPPPKQPKLRQPGQS
jgi:hypothetical protein